MRESIRDFTLAVAALAALFAAFQSWTTGRDLAAFREDFAADLAAVREDLAAVRGQLETTTGAVLAHVNAPSLHGGRD